MVWDLDLCFEALRNCVALLKALDSSMKEKQLKKYMLLPELLHISEYQGPRRICLLPVTAIKGTCNFNYLEQKSSDLLISTKP